jgi:hypothetical protein
MEEFDTERDCDDEIQTNGEHYTIHELDELFNGSDEPIY